MVNSLFSRDQIYLAGSWVSDPSRGTLEVIDPSTGQVIGSVPEATTADADRAIAAGNAVYESREWSNRAPTERAAVLRLIAEGLRSRSNELDRLYVEDQGGLATLAPFISRQSAAIFDEVADYADQLPTVPERRNTALGSSLMRRLPVGVVGAIIPWNAPLIMAAIKLAPALLAGCPVVAKVSPETSLVSFILADVIDNIDLPPGLVSFLPGGRGLGRYLVAHPGISHVTFTGSTASGQDVMRSAADHMTRVTLELGGKSAGIILADVEPIDIAATLTAACMSQSGQVCTTQSRLLVPRSRETEWRDALTKLFASLPIGDPRDVTTVIGPLVSQQQLARVERYVAVAREEATIATGGERPSGVPSGGYYIQPTLVTDVRSDMRIMTEEVFGPVICLMGYDTVDEAIRIANGSQYGLGSAIYSNDIDRAISLAPELISGTVSINNSGACMAAPFGGRKMSGIGREGGIEAVYDFMEWHQTQLPVGMLA